VKIALILLVPFAIWGSSVVVWRWVVRRLELGRIPDAELGDRERLVHRNLRHLLAFNFLLWYPVSLPMAIAMLFSGDRDLVAPALAMLAGVVAFSVPLLSLMSSARELQRQRTLGMAPREEPSIWVDDPGGALMVASREGRHGATVGFVLLLVGGGFIYFQHDSFQRAAVGLVLSALGFVVYELSRRRAGSGPPGG
jgi:hypothetical protein